MKPCRIVHLNSTTEVITSFITTPQKPSNDVFVRVLFDRIDLNITIRIPKFCSFAQKLLALFFTQLLLLTGPM